MEIRRAFFVLMGCLLAIPSLQGKGGPDPEELKLELPALRGDARVDQILAIAEGYQLSHPDSAMRYAQWGFTLAQQGNTPYLKALAHQVLGKVYDYRGEMIIAHDYFTKGLELMEGEAYPKLKAHLNNSIGIIHAKRGEYALGLGYFISAKEIWKNLGNRKREAILLSNIGRLHMDIGDYESSLNATLKALELSRYFENVRLQASCTHNLGEIYQAKGDLRNALNTYQKALAMKEALGSPLRLISTLKGMGEVYIQLSLFQQAQEQFDQAMDIAQSQNNQEYMQELLLSMASLQQTRGNYRAAINLATQSLELAEKQNNQDDLLACYQFLAEVYAQQNQMDQAYGSLKTYAYLKDSLYNAQRNSLLAELNTKYRLSARNEEIQKLRLEQEQSDLRTQRLWMLIGFSAIALLITLLLFRNKRNANRLLAERNLAIATQNELLEQKQAEIEQKNQLLAQKSKEISLQNRQLQQSNQDLKQFVYAASHDLREPLRTIRSYMQLITKRYKTQLDTSAQEFIGFATDGAVRMDQLLQDLLSYSRIGRESIPKTSVDLNKVIQRVQDALDHQIHQNQAELHVAPLPYVHAYETQMYLLFQNLISNAIKFRQEQPPRIFVDARQEAGHYLLTIADNGIGIEKEHQERVFSLFHRLHPRSKFEGTGMGLAMCRRIVEHHQGEIWLDSEPGKGTTMFIRIPAGLPAAEPSRLKG